MDRRESLKALLVGTVAGATLGLAGAGCTPESTEAPVVNTNNTLYGRTPEELEHDQEVSEEIFLNEHELATIAVLCDIILPASDTAGSANEAGVPDFIDFIVKDIPRHQLPMRGGLMWMDTEAKNRFEKNFVDCDATQQTQIIDDIAYPENIDKNPELAYGIKFFNVMRNLTLTGYYTTKMGIDDLGYVGNFPNVWDGVPEEVLKEHDVEYDPEWLAKCVDQSKRNVIAEWDDEGNLLT